MVNNQAEALGLEGGAHCYLEGLPVPQLREAKLGRLETLPGLSRTPSKPRREETDVWLN